MKACRCGYCGRQLGEARMVVHDPNGISGTFCVGSGDNDCFGFARAGRTPVSTRRILDDLETLARAERVMAEGHH